MAIFVRAKRVTGPLDSAARARICGLGGGSANSGSEHGSLSDLVHDFLDSSSCTSLPDVYTHAESTSDSPDASATLNVVRTALGPDAERDPFGARLLHVARTLAVVGPDPGLYRRAVMAGLRAAGYNAGLCNARWEAGGGVTAGAHEYVDVVVEAAAAASTTRRYIVDVDFAAEFEIARPTAEYARVLAALPRVVVARPEEVRWAVRAVAEAAQRSLRTQGLSVPPWRKGRYMQAKWTAPYRRITNVLPGGGASAGEVKCRAIGFQAGPGLVVRIR